MPEGKERHREERGMSVRYGCIEAGGTKFVCGFGTGPDDLIVATIPTTTPDETISRAVSFLQGAGELAAVGIGSFGPVDVRTGCITNTPKRGWQHCDVSERVRRAVGVPVVFDTDVNAAALGEGRWGAARGLTDFLYLTVGTGIGGGAVVNGRVLHGLGHPEMGHIRIPHDVSRDPYPGGCPFHGDCLEGLASGPAIEARRGCPGTDLAQDDPVWQLEGQYLALGLATLVCTLSPQKIVMGGGVMQQQHLFGLIRCELGRLLNGYVETPEVTPPLLGSRAGVLGAMALAEMAVSERR
jgi:fructokinase